jgi:hypothetical protein
MFTDAQIKTVVQSALEFIPPNKTLEPGPAQHPAGPKAALRHCCVAWKRAFKAYMEDPNADVPGDELFASKDAGEAYRNAMPLLVGYNGARDFIACAAHGILIGAIPKEDSGQILYAAQVALSIAQSQSRLPKIPASRTPKSPPKSAKKPASKRATPPLPPAKSPNRVGRKRRSSWESAA